MIADAAAIASEDADAVGFIDHEHRIGILLFESDDVGQRSEVALHGEDAIYDDELHGVFFAFLEFALQVIHVVVLVANLLRHRQPSAIDVVTRKKRMEGYNVLFPIGFDAFGLPTENFAIKNHVHPAVVTQENIKNFTRQLKMLGYGFDWDRCVDTTDPKYYKWTQWIFLQLFKHGLAYKTTMPVNWCTSCKCVLANEEVVEGVCERCGSEVVRKEKSQWMLRITKYADRLIDDLDDVDGRYYHYTGKESQRDSKYVCPVCGRSVHYGSGWRYYCDFCNKSCFLNVV